MKKEIIAFFALFILAGTQLATAQITGTGNNNRMDTAMRPKLPPTKRTYIDTIPRHHKDSMKCCMELQRLRDSLHRKHRLDSTAKAIGNKGAEVGAKVAASIKDRSLKNVKGPNGETVYVDKYDRRYYINKEGKRIYLPKPKTK